MKNPRIVLFPLFLLPLLMLSTCGGPLSLPGTAAGGGASKAIISKGTDEYGTVHEIGVLGPGAQYEIWVPAGWRAGPRSLLMYVHGYVAAAAPVSLPRDLDPVLPGLLQQGFAVADSSYSQNGWAVKDAAIRTRQLRGYFEGNYGAPGLVYLMGVSEGGNVVMKLVQQNPELFSGALAVSGVVGSAQTEMSYILNERVLFDYFFRGKLRGLAQAGDHIAGLVDTALGNSALAAGPGDTGLPSDGAQFAGLVGQTVGTILALSPTETAALATMKVDGQKMFNWPDEMLGTPDFGTEMTITVATGLWFSIFGTQDMLQRTHGRSPVDTRGSGYWSPVLALIPGAIEALNGESGVERLTSSPAARNYLDNWYQPVGRLRIPLVTLHTSRDPVVPIAQEYRLQGIVQGASADMLAQFIAYGFGHVQILMPPSYLESDPAFWQQMLAAFGYLQAWVAARYKPPVEPFGLTPLP